MTTLSVPPSDHHPVLGNRQRPGHLERAGTESCCSRGDIAEGHTCPPGGATETIRWSQNECARLSGISPGYLSQPMSGARCTLPAGAETAAASPRDQNFDDLFIMEQGAR